LDALTNPTATDLMDSVTVPHATQHANANDAIEAIQAELGTDPAGASATVKARLDAVDSDSRWTDARTPTAHKTSHEDGGSDELTLAQSQVANLTTDLAAKSPATCLYLAGSTGSYVSAPDTAGVSVVGDIDLRCKIALDDWTPAATVRVFSKYGTNPQISWVMSILTTGHLRLTWIDSGGTAITKDSTVAPTVADGATLSIRISLDVDNGASGNDVTFYMSTDDGANWTQLGSTVTTAGVTSIRDSTAPVEVGSWAGGAAGPAGKFFSAQILSGIAGTIVADWRGDTPAARYRDAYGNVFTVNGTANGWMVA
jgi:hypothetical protein